MSTWCDHCEVASDQDVCSLCGADLTAPEREPIPWRWRLFLVATVIYLGWRFYQLLSWLLH